MFHRQFSYRTMKGGDDSYAGELTAVPGIQLFEQRYGDSNALFCPKDMH